MCERCRASAAAVLMAVLGADTMKGASQTEMFDPEDDVATDALIESIMEAAGRATVEEPEEPQEKTYGLVVTETQAQKILALVGSVRDDDEMMDAAMRMYDVGIPIRYVVEAAVRAATPRPGKSLILRELTEDEQEQF